MSNKNHPELREGEIFLTNASDVRIAALSNESTFSLIEWKSKRAGNIAYDESDGNVILGLFPVFVQKQELIDAGVDVGRM